MIYDIAAIQSHYGYNRTSATGFGGSGSEFTLGGGNKVWTLWDGGGSGDILKVAADEPHDAVLDLRGGLGNDGKPHWSHVGDEYVAIAFDPNNASGVVEIEQAWGGNGDDLIIGGSADNILRGNGGSDTLLGGVGIDKLYGGDAADFLVLDENDIAFGDGGDDVIGVYTGIATLNGSTPNNGSVAHISGGAGADHFGVFGRAYIEDIAPEDYVYVNNFQVTGGMKDVAFDAPVGWNYVTGHGFQVYNGNINDPEGATLAVKWLWDTDAVAFIDNYTRPYLGAGEGHIEIYEIGIGEKTSIKDMGKAYSLMFGNGNPLFDPLVLDLDGDGVELANRGNQGVFFEMDSDGFAEQTSWLKTDDAFLVRDINSNGKIDNIGEMFGNQTTSGFSALAAFNNNNSGTSANAINSADSIWSSLRLWRDADHDGVTDAGELLTLASQNITAIGLNNTVSGALQNGNEIAATGTFTKTIAGVTSTGIVADVRFDVSQQNTQWMGTQTISGGVAALPWIKGRGDLKNLDIAMMQDTTVFNAVNTLDTRPIGTLASFDSYISDVLYKWAGVQSISTTSRGANFDGRKLAFLEEYAGEPFKNGGNPTVAEAAELQDVWNKTFDHARAMLLVQGPYATYFSDLQFDRAGEVYDPTGMQLRSVIDKILDGMPAGATAAATYWNNFIPLLNVVKDFVIRTVPVTEDFLGGHSLTEYTAVGMTDTQLATDIVEAAIGRSLPVTLGGLLAGVASDAAAGGNLAPILAQTNGATVAGTTGNDLIVDIAANTTLGGGKGSDTYVIGPNFGQLVVKEDSGVGYSKTLIGQAQDMLTIQSDTIRFTHLTSANATLSREGDDLLIRQNNSTNSVRVVDHFGHEGTPTVLFSSGSADHTIEQIVFADGAAKTTIEIRGEIITAQETDGNDYIEGTSDNDLLRGHKGQDTLVGGDDGDTYKFWLGDGHDIIQDKQQDFFLDEADQAVFGNGLNLDDATLQRVTLGANGAYVLDARGEDLLMTFNANDSVLIDGQFWRSPLGYSQFNPYSFLGQAIHDNPLWSLGSSTQLPPEFDSTGYTNETGITFTQDTVTGEYIAHVEDLDYSYIAYTSTEYTNGNITIPAPDNRIENFIFMSDGSIVTAEGMQQVIVDRAKTDGNDLVIGFGQRETLDGGAGNDTLEGGDDGDTYRFDTGYGQDVIIDKMEGVFFKAPDVVKLGDHITTSNIHLSRPDGSNDLIISVDGYTDTLTVKGQFSSTTVGLNSFFSLDQRMEELHFADGTVWNWLQLQQKLLVSTSGDDLLQGYFNNDILDGGAGNDTLKGGDMGDVYVYGYGYDNDVIHDEMSSILFKDNDKLNFTPGITKNDVSLSLGEDHSDLIITLKSSGETLTIEDQFHYSTFGPGSVFSINFSIEEFYFQDGSAWSYDDIMEILTHGTSGNDELYGFFREDTLDGGAGNDRLEAGTESDTYIYRKGYGNDVIYDSHWGIAEDNDRILFNGSPNGLASTDVTFSRLGDGETLVIKILATGETLTIENQFTNYNVGGPPYQIEQFVFTDRTMTSGDIMPLTTTATTGNDTLYGSYFNETFDGGAGNDRLEGREGADTYKFGRGDGYDTVYEYEGDVFLRGDDRILFKSGVLPADVEVLRNGDTNNLILRIKDTGETITVLDHHAKYNVGPAFYEIATVEFESDPNAVWDTTDIRATLLDHYTTPGNDSVYGFYTADRLDGGTGNDLLNGHDGGDTYIYHFGYGNDTINDTFSNVMLDDDDTVDFGNAITSSMATLTKINNDLKFNFSSHATDSLYIKDYFTSYYDIELFKFSDITWKNTDVITRLSGAGNGNDMLTVIAGLNTLSGGAGNDIIDFGTTTVTSVTRQAWGESGNDTYRFGRDYGKITVYEKTGDQNTSGADKIEFLSGIAQADLDFKRNGNSLIIKINGTSDEITVRDHFLNVTHGVESIIMNGITYNTQSLLTTTTDGGDSILGTPANENLFGGGGDDTIRGNGGNDTYDGGIGNDYLESGNGSNETYLFYIGGGNDTVWDQVSGLGYASNDIVLFGDGITSDNITLLRDGDNIIIGINGSDDSLTIMNQYKNGTAASEIENFQFANGLVWSSQDVLNKILVSSDANDHILGSTYADTIQGGNGNDIIQAWNGADYVTGDSGNDSIDGGFGNDTLFGGDGADTIDGSYDTDIIYGGGGNDSIKSGLGFDTIYGEAGDDIIVSGGTITAFGGTGNDTITGGVDDIYNGGDGNDLVFIDDFSANMYVNLSTSTANYNGANVISITSIESIKSGRGNDTLIGSSGDNYLYGNMGNDTIYGGGGNDTLAGCQGTNSYDGGAGNDFLDLGIVENSFFPIHGVAILVNLATGTAQAAANIESFTSIEAVITGNGNDTIYGGAGDNTLDGRAGNDSISGSTGNDVLLGRAGNDTLLGDAGRDSLSGGDGKDVFSIRIASDSTNTNPDTILDFVQGQDIIDLQELGFTGIQQGAPIGSALGYSYGVDKTIVMNQSGSFVLNIAGLLNLTGADFNLGINGTHGNDSLGGSGNLAEILRGLDGNDTLRGYNGNDRLFGGNGDDWLDGGAGNDTLDGGAGIDVADYSSWNPSWTLNLSTNQGMLTVDGQIDIFIGIENLKGGFGNDTLVGNNANNLLMGYIGTDNISGGDGNDTLDGGTGIDTLIGGTGNDNYLIDSLSDVVTETANGGIDLIQSTLTYTLQDEVENLTLLSISYINGTGNAKANILIGNSVKNILMGGDGNDTLDGGAGADTLVGGTGSDKFIFSALTDSTTTQRDVIQTWNSSDTIDVSGAAFVSAGIDTFSDFTISTVSGGNTTVTNGTFSFIIEGVQTLTASNFIFGGSSVSTVPSAGDDSITGNDDSVTGDTINGQTGNDTIIGQSGNDQLTGSDGNDSLVGGVGGDMLDGSIGDDTLFGGAGIDVLKGRAGKDMFVYQQLSDSSITGRDQIQVWDNDDRIDLSAAEFVNAGIDAFSDFTINNTGSNTTVTGGTFSVVILGQQTLSAINFIFGGSSTNVAPTVAPGGIPDQAVTIGTAFNYTIANGIFTDSDGDVLTYTTSALPSGVSFDASEHKFYGTPTGSAGTVAITVTVNDGHSHTVSDQFNFVIGSGGNSTVPSGGNDYITGDTVAANNPDNIDGLAGNDTISGLGGADTLTGGEGDDSLIGGAGYNKLYGGNGNDILLGGADGNYFNGGAGTDTLTGGTSNDDMHGGSESDTLDGGSGSDKLYGDDGRDSLTGGAGVDSFYFTALTHSGIGTANRDIITDFVSGTDKLNFAVLIPGGVTFIGVSAFDGSGNAEFCLETSGSNKLGKLDADGNGTTDMEFLFLSNITLTQGDLGTI